MTTDENARLVHLLMSICENPGWQPSEPVASTVERDLERLQREGWILPRLDGWEAAPNAVERYPHFYVDHNGLLTGELTDKPPRDELDRPGYERPAPEPASDNPWETTHVLPTLIVGEKQEMRTAIDIAGLKGGVSIANARADGQRVEVEITTRIRRVQ